MEMKKAFIFLGGLIAGVVIKNKCEEYIKYELIGFAFVGAATTGYGIYKGVKTIYKHFKEKKSKVSEENEEPIVDVKNVESEEETSEE